MSEQPKIIHNRMPTLAEREEFATDDFRGCGWMFGVLFIILLAFACYAIRATVMDSRNPSLPAEEARIAREAAEAAQAAERERIAKAEQERKDREAAERRAARAPDKQKLEAWLESMPDDMPAMKTDAGMLAMESIKQKFMRFLGEAQKVVAELS